MPRGDRISTSIYYKETDSHSYLNFKSMHPFNCKSAIPYSQFLRLRKICSEDDESANTMETFFVARGYPIHLVRDGRQKATSTPRAALLTARDARNRTTATKRVPIVTTYHPKNTYVCNILQRSFNILENDECTQVIFPQPPLKAYRRAKDLKDLLVHSNLPSNNPPHQPGTFPCRRTICHTCPHITEATSIPAPGGHIKITGHFTCISENIIYCISRRKCPKAVYIGETGRRLAGRFREHRLDVLHNKGDLPVAQRFNGPSHSLEDMRVAVVRGGLKQRDLRQHEEMRLIFLSLEHSPLSGSTVISHFYDRARIHLGTRSQFSLFAYDGK